MNIGLFEDGGWQDLLPLTWLRAGFELRCGCDQLIDKVRSNIKGQIAGWWLRPELNDVLAERIELATPDSAADWCLINARALVTGSVTPPRAGVVWRDRGDVIAVGLRAADLDGIDHTLFCDLERLAEWLKKFEPEEPPPEICLIRHPWDLMQHNEAELYRQCRDGGVHQGEIYPGAHLLHPAEIQIAPGARIKPGAVLDAESGPIRIAENALIQPNAVLEGPCYVGPNSIIRPGCALREATSIGPVCKIGGEIEASIVHGYSNKQHDGFLGHSYVGQWVNLGADTVTSDLKNTYGTIRVFINGVGVETGQHFVGSIIGDHSKTGIGTILPTGGVVGIAANVFTSGSVPKFVPSFAWLTSAGLTNYRVDKAVHIAHVVTARRDLEFSRFEEHLFQSVAERSRTIEAAGWQ